MCLLEEVQYTTLCACLDAWQEVVALSISQLQESYSSVHGYLSS